MEKITFLDNGEPAYRIDGVVYKNEVASKLHDYEETGLSPEEVVRLKERLQIDPSGSDKIDELEEAMAYMRSKQQDHVQCKDCEYLCKIDGKICCGYPRMFSNGENDWCCHGKKRSVDNDT